MESFYAYDADGDDMKDDCAELGAIDATDIEAAMIEARNIWPNVANIRIA